MMFPVGHQRSQLTTLFGGGLGERLVVRFEKDPSPTSLLEEVSFFFFFFPPKKISSSK